MRCIVIRKSGEKSKMSKNNHPYLCRYVLLQPEDDPTKAYLTTIFPSRATGYYPPIYTYSLINVDLKIGRDAGVGDQDKNLEGEFYQSVTWANINNMDNIQVEGYLTQEKAVSFGLDRCHFEYQFLACDDLQLKIAASDLGFDHFPLGLNKVELTGLVSITGQFEYRLRPVYNDQTRKKDFITAYIYKEGSVDISRSELSSLSEIVAGVDTANNLEAAIKEIRQLLTSGVYLEVERVRHILDAHGLPDESPTKILESVTFKPNYEPIFFHELRRVQDSGFKIYYSDDGFMFHIKGNWAWEVPEYGTATYIFKDQNLTELTAMLGEVNRKDILMNTEVSQRLKFRRRAIHPADLEDDRGLQRWLLDVQNA